jgi:hypothetical protein
MGLLDSRINQVAENFNVEPIKLLSHVLLFDISLDSLTKASAENSFDRENKNMDYVDSIDRKISVALRNNSQKSIVKEVLKILNKYGENDYDEAKAEVIAYLNARSEEA